MIGLFGGVAANGQWRTFLLWANRVPFHAADPYFHKDVGFYVFTLPWLHFVVGYVIAVLVLSALSRPRRALPLRRHPPPGHQ